MKNSRSYSLFTFINPYLLIFALVCPTLDLAASEAPIQKPKLILTIVFDQFRADYIQRFQSRFMPAKSSNGQLGGFNLLLSKAAYFPLGEYGLLQNMTGPGHASILSGSYAYQFGIPTNVWFDSDTQQVTYCVADSKHPVVGPTPQDTKKGLSPANFLGSTLGDELKHAGRSSKVVTVALKDRAAILMGGYRADLAMWFDMKTYQWVSSTWYLPENKLPAFFGPLNEQMKKEVGSIYKWKSAKESTGLSDSGPFDKDLKLGDDQGLNSPHGLEVTVAAADAAMKHFNLGHNPKDTDLLAVSFSSHDYVVHHFGPNSREAEEMAVADDRALSDLLNRVQKAVPGGLSNVWVVLTADHGVSPDPEYLSAHRVPAAHLIEGDLTKELEQLLTARFGKPGDGKWISFFQEFNIYLNAKAMAEAKADRVAVEDAVKAFMLKQVGVAHAFSRTDVALRHLPPGIHETQILHTYYAGRSGDVVVIPKPYYSQDGYKAAHVTGYNYDRRVPLFFMGSPFVAGRYSIPGHVIDIAPTLAYAVGVLPPATSEGRVLSEIISQH